MSFARESTYPSRFTFAAQAAVDARAEFLLKTYLHLAGAIAAFVTLEAALLQTPGIENAIRAVFSLPFSWLLVLGAFMVVSVVANRWAQSATSVGLQYVGLALYVVAEGVIFVPLLYVASQYGGPSVIPTAGLITLIIFSGLSAIVFITRKDFSFLRGVLWLGGLVAMGFIVCSLLIGFSLGTVFTVAMIAFAGGWVLYDTSNVLHHYRIGQHVAASLALFASIALLFWYVLQLVLSLDRD
ncbi:MAG: Bax inhibitor-1/YccA family protein [Planctomycetes bacterium]|nr:Bax inhibitor-1/YccA family protein [Planctomycetota bacterium]